MRDIAPVFWAMLCDHDTTRTTFALAENPLTIDELAELLVATGHHHHQAYIDSDGVDPEWALWYAGYLQSHIWDRFGAVPTRSSLVHLLIEAERRFDPAADGPAWPPSYAALIIDRLGAS